MSNRRQVIDREVTAALAEAEQQQPRRRGRPPAVSYRVGALAHWRDPAEMPEGQIVQVRLQNGDIFDGARFDFGTGRKVYAYDPNLENPRVVTPMGWLPLSRGVALPVATISIGEVEARVFSALRTLRSIRVKDAGPRGDKVSGIWKKLMREREDLMGCWVEGRWIGRHDYQRSAPDEPGLSEIYEPKPHESNAEVLFPPLGWFTRLKGPSVIKMAPAFRPDFATELYEAIAEVAPGSKEGQAVREHRGLQNYLDDKLAALGVPQAEFDYAALGKPVRAASGARAQDAGKFTLAQQLVWDRSAALVAPVGRGDRPVPPSWKVIGSWNDLEAEQARNRFADAMRRLWYIANTEETVSGGGT